MIRADKVVEMFDFAGKRIWVAGAHGMVGAAITRAGMLRGYTLIPSPMRSQLDLRDTHATKTFIATHKPDVIFLAAARVGGILDNATNPDEFLHDNLSIQNNVIQAAARNNVEKLVFLGSSCIYPRDCPQPMREDMLETGPLEPTNAAYATAKLDGISLVQYYRSMGHDFISLLPCNLYGPNDTYDLIKSHVIPAMILKIKNFAPDVTLWGTGTPKREFMHVDDLADACWHLAANYSEDAPINVGTAEEITIKNLALLIADIMGQKINIRFDETKPDGVMRKCLDLTRLSATSWKYRISLQQGLVSLLR